MIRCRNVTPFFIRNGMMKFFLIVIVSCLLYGDLSLGFTYTIDMEQSSVCATMSEVSLGLYDVANIYAEPRPISTPTRDSCAIKFKSQGGGGFKIFVRDLIFGECQVFVKVYEDLYLNTEKYAFGCNTNPGGLYRTLANEIIVRLEKPGPESHSYKFYIRVALNDGPDIGGTEGGDTDADTVALGTGALAGIIVAALIGTGVAIAVIVYCVIVWRKKKEEKELAQSISVVFPSGKSDTVHHDGSSVHSSSAHVSWHSTKVPSENQAFTYPAYRTQASISEKAPKCNSIDSKSFDSDNTDGSKLIKDKPQVKSARKELDSLRRTIFKIERDKEREKEEELRFLEQERDRRDHRHEDTALDRRDGSLTSGRHASKRSYLNAENIKTSLRDARERGRSFGTDHNKQRSSHSGSVRSSRSKHKARSHSPARSNASTRDSDFYSDRYDHRSRHDRSRSGHRSSSARRGNRGDRDYYSDYDYDSRDRHRSGRYRGRDRDAYSEEYSDDDRYSHRSYRSEGHRTRSGSEGHRTRSSNSGRRRR